MPDKVLHLLLSHAFRSRGLFYVLTPGCSRFMAHGKARRLRQQKWPGRGFSNSTTVASRWRLLLVTKLLLMHQPFC